MLYVTSLLILVSLSIGNPPWVWYFRSDQCVLIHLLLGHDLNEECYPYEAEDLKCRYEKSCEYTKGVVTDQVYSYGTNEEELKTMVVEYGPVVTGLDATALQFYDSGILDDFMCCDAADDFECVYVFYTIFKNLSDSDGVEIFLLVRSNFSIFRLVCNS